MSKPIPLVSLKEICVLCKYMALSKGTFVEIGTYYGGTSSLIAGVFSERRIITIDIKKRHADETFADLKNVIFIESNSSLISDKSFLDIWLNPIGVLFVDGEHTQEAVGKDIHSWSPYVEAGGFVVIHDAIVQEANFRSVDGSLLVHYNQNGELESGYVEIGEIAKQILSKGWTLVCSVDSSLIFRKE